jgi:hypothetical protein
MQIVEFCLDAEMRMTLRLLLELLDEFIDLDDFFLILYLFKVKSVFLEEEEVDPVETLEIIVGGVYEFVVLVLHWRPCLCI